MKSYAKALLNCILNVYCSKRCINSVLEVLNGIWNQQKTKYKKLDSNEKAKTKTKDTNTKKQQNKTEKKEMGLHGWPPTKTRKNQTKKKQRNQNQKKHRFRTLWGVPNQNQKKTQIWDPRGESSAFSSLSFFFLVWFLWFWIFLVLVGDPPWGPKSLVFWFWFLWFWFFWSWFFLVLVGDPHGVLNLFFLVLVSLVLFFVFGVFGLVENPPWGYVYVYIVYIYILYVYLCHTIYYCQNKLE